MTCSTVAFVILAFASACDSSDAEPGAADPAREPETALSGPIVTQREHFVMVHEKERCQIDILRDDAPTERIEEDIACPKDLALGERIRLLGMVCMREGSTADRNVPTICPGTLVRAERSYRRALASARASGSAPPSAAQTSPVPRERRGTP